MVPPIAFPAERLARLHHRAGEITALRRYAPRRRPVSAASANAAAGHRRAPDEHVAVRTAAARAPEESDQRVARLLRVCVRTRLIRSASAVDLASGNPRKTDARTLGAPHRAVTVPDSGRRALEDFAGRHNGNSGGGGEEQDTHGCAYGALPAWRPARSRDRHRPSRCRRDRFRAGYCRGPQMAVFGAAASRPF